MDKLFQDIDSQIAAESTESFDNTFHKVRAEMTRGQWDKAFRKGYEAALNRQKTVPEILAGDAALPADAGMERAADADTIVSVIIKDIRDRKGIGDAWESIEVDIRNEIVSDWRKAIRAASAQVNAEGRTPCYSEVKPEAIEVGGASSDRLNSVPPTPAGNNRTGEDLGQDDHRVPAQSAPSAPDAGQVVVPVDPQRYVWTRDGMMSVTGNGEYVSSIIFDALQQVLKAEIHKHEITKQLFDEELADGDKLCSSLCFERTEGGRLPVRKMIADIGDVAMRCKRAEAEASERDALLRAADAIRAEAAKPSTTDTKHR